MAYLINDDFWPSFMRNKIAVNKMIEPKFIDDFIGLFVMARPSKLIVLSLNHSIQYKPLLKV